MPQRETVKENTTEGREQQEPAATAGSAPADEAPGDETSTEGLAPEGAESEENGCAEEIEALEAERDEINERLLRTAAELQNVRRRAEREKGRLATAGKTRVLRPMLDVLDDFERTLEAAEQFGEGGDGEEADPAAAYRSLHEGVELVYHKLTDELARLGVEHIEAEGTPFDEDLHEAVMQQPASDDAEPGTVLTEVQKGYRLESGRVLRHSKVVVAA